MTEQLSHKAQELLNAFNKAEAKWTEEINQRNEFIRRRDHTIATQIDTINSVSQEVLDLTQKVHTYSYLIIFNNILHGMNEHFSKLFVLHLQTKKLEDESKELLNRLNTEEAQVIAIFLPFRILMKNFNEESLINFISFIASKAPS